MTKISVFADGGCILRNPSPIGGTFAYCFVDEQGNRFREHSGVLTPIDCDGPVTNNITELHALCAAIWCIRNLPDWEDQRYHIYSDSNVSLIRVFRCGKLNNVPDYLAQLVGKVRTMLGRIDFQYTLLDGHPTREQLSAGIGKRGNKCSEHNVRCDWLCNEEGRKYRAMLAEREAVA
jgi:ribonuclease HI